MRDDSKCKEIRCESMRLSHHYLRRHVAWSSTGVLLVILPRQPRNAQVSQPQISVSIKHQVLWFEIAMDDAISMQVLQSQHDIADKKFGLFLVEVLSIAKMVAQISSVKVIQHEVEVLAILKGAEHVGQKRMGQFRQVIAFIHHGCHRFLGYYFGFAHLLHGEGSSAASLDNLPHFSVPSFADRQNNLKVTLADLLIPMCTHHRVFLHRGLMLLRYDIIVSNPALGVNRRDALIADTVSKGAVTVEVEIEVVAE